MCISGCESLPTPGEVLTPAAPSGRQTTHHRSIKKWKQSRDEVSVSVIEFIT